MNTRSKYNNILNWCTKNPYNYSDKNKANILENKWGNLIFKTKNKTQWSSKIGEFIVSECLLQKGIQVYKPEIINHYRPDLETNKFIYEIKTRNWTTVGTAGEKVYGVPYKYSDIPRLYSKPLRIVCVAYQEFELTNGYSNIFGDNISEEKKEMLDFWKERDIEFIPFTDIINNKLLNY